MSPPARVGWRATALKNIDDPGVLRRSGKHRPVAWTCQRLDLPDALAAVAAVALDHPRARGEPRRQFGAHRLGRSIECRVAAPAQLFTALPSWKKCQHLCATNPKWTGRFGDLETISKADSRPSG